MKRPVRRMAAAAIFAVSVATTSFAAQPTARAENPAAAALLRLGALAGEWKGSVEWTGARTGRYAMDASYSTTGNGSAVVETLTQEGVAMMTTVYHADGSDLRMTHYCGTKNQPRLKASRIDLATGAIDFAFVDATNLASPDAPHVSGLEVRFGDADHLTITFRFEGGGKPAFERISLQRSPPKA
jgi:hypothetical protein